MVGGAHGAADGRGGVSCFCEGLIFSDSNAKGALGVGHTACHAGGIEGDFDIAFCVNGDEASAIFGKDFEDRFLGSLV